MVGARMAAPPAVLLQGLAEMSQRLVCTTFAFPQCTDVQTGCGGVQTGCRGVASASPLTFFSLLRCPCPLMDFPVWCLQRHGEQGRC